jgi:hypothetical protein
VVLDAPQHLEAQRLGEVAQAQLVGVDALVVARVAAALEDGGVSDSHRASDPSVEFV